MPRLTEQMKQECRRMRADLNPESHGPGSCVPSEEVDATTAGFDKEIEMLKASLMVLDATIYMILSVWDKPQFQAMFKSQIATAKETYEQATGQESMIGFKRPAATVTVGLSLDGKQNQVEWPWCEVCEVCNSYHHPDNKSCRKIKS